MQRYLYEVFEDISKSKTKEEAVEKVKQYNEIMSKTSERDALAFRTLFKGTVDLAVIWGLPKYEPKYIACQEHNAPSNLYREITKNVSYFADGAPDYIPDRKKRELMYIKLLEAIAPKDAQLVLDMVRQKSSYKHITATVAREAFGDDFLAMDKLAGR